MLLQVASRLLFAPSPNRLGAVTCDRSTAGGYHQYRPGSLDPRRQALGSVPRQVPPRHCASQSSVFARPPWPSIPLPRPSLLTSTLTLLSLVFWPVYIFATLTAHCKFPPNKKKLELPPTPPAQPARAPVTCSFTILCAYFHFPFLSHYRVSQSSFLPTTAVWATLRTRQHTPPSRITGLVQITSHVFVRRLRR